MGQEFGINIWKYSKEKYQHIESIYFIFFNYLFMYDKNTWTNIPIIDNRANEFIILWDLIYVPQKPIG